jgi:voltage-gated potassium channel
MNTVARVGRAWATFAGQIEATRARVFRLLEGEHSRAGRVISIGLLTLIVLNLVAVMLETVRIWRGRFAAEYIAFESFSVAVFSVEYLLRLWTCTSAARYRGTIRGRIRFMLSPLALVDLVAIIPAYLPGDIVWDLRYVRIFRLFRLLRVLKMARYSRTLKTFANVASAKRWDLGIIAFLLAVMLMVSSITMYFAEHEAQPDTFSSVPAAMWWAVVTLTTVGYGDIFPVTPLGKFLGAIIALIGIGLFALPAGILAAGFAEEIHKERHKICPHCGKDLP